MTLNCYNFIEISPDFHPTLWAAAARDLTEYDKYVEGFPTVC